MIDLVLSNRAKMEELRPKPDRSLTFNLAASITFLELVKLDRKMKEITDAKALMDMQAIIAAQQATAGRPPAVQRFVRRPQRVRGHRQRQHFGFWIADHNCPAKVSGTSGIYWKILVFRSVMSAHDFNSLGQIAAAGDDRVQAVEIDKCTRASLCSHN